MGSSTERGDLHFNAVAKVMPDADCDLTLVPNWKPSPIMGRLLDFWSGSAIGMTWYPSNHLRRIMAGMMLTRYAGNVLELYGDLTMKEPQHAK